jgi:hypothetical protein
MTQDRDSDLVAGELRSDLVRAMSHLKIEDSPEGAAIMEGHMSGETAAPFVRAIMRVEAELLLQDANLFTGGLAKHRTTAQRRADALVILARRVGSSRIPS